jgi:hypothetical protein
LAFSVSNVITLEGVPRTLEGIIYRTGTVWSKRRRVLAADKMMKRKNMIWIAVFPPSAVVLLQVLKLVCDLWHRDAMQ